MMATESLQLIHTWYADWAVIEISIESAENSCGFVINTVASSNYVRRDFVAAITEREKNRVDVVVLDFGGLIGQAGSLFHHVQLARPVVQTAPMMGEFKF